MYIHTILKTKSMYLKGIKLSVFLTEIVFTVRYELKPDILFRDPGGWVVAGLSPQRPRFNPLPVHAKFVVKKVTLTGISPSTSVFPCQYDSTIAPNAPSS
jgi:hypothetical protein